MFAVRWADAAKGCAPCASTTIGDPGLQSLVAGCSGLTALSIDVTSVEGGGPLLRGRLTSMGLQTTLTSLALSQLSLSWTTHRPMQGALVLDDDSVTDGGAVMALTDGVLHAVSSSAATLTQLALLHLPISDTHALATSSVATLLDTLSRLETLELTPPSHPRAVAAGEARNKEAKWFQGLRDTPPRRCALRKLKLESPSLAVTAAFLHGYGALLTHLTSNISTIRSDLHQAQNHLGTIAKHAPHIQFLDLPVRDSQSLAPLTDPAMLPELSRVRASGNEAQVGWIDTALVARGVTLEPEFYIHPRPGERTDKFLARANEEEDEEYDWVARLTRRQNRKRQQLMSRIGDAGSDRGDSDDSGDDNSDSNGSDCQDRAVYTAEVCCVQ